MKKTVNAHGFILVALIFSLSVSLALFFKTDPSEASTTCNFLASGTSTITSDCSITSGVEGVDNGGIVIGSNTTLTIEDGASLVLNRGREIKFTDTTSFIRIAGIKSRSVDGVTKGILCAQDSNSNRYADKLGTEDRPAYSLSTGTSCPANWTRKSSLLSLTNLECPSGQYINEGVCRDCEAGSWCSFNTSTGLHEKTACPPDTYSTSTKATSASVCQSCPANTTSSAGSSNPDLCQGCPEGSFLSGRVCYLCGYGQAYPNNVFCKDSVRYPVTYKWYSIGGVAGNETMTRTDQSPCPAGSWCQMGTKYYCSGGRYGSEADSPTTNSSCSGLCSANYYCPAGSTSPIEHACDPGKLSRPGSSSASDCIYCGPGYFFDTTNGVCQNCGDNNHFSKGGTTSCTAVSAGWYSTGQTSTTRTDQSQCVEGTYCQSGVKYDCPCGSYCGSKGITIPASCPAGYCTQTNSTSTASFPCTAGYICAAGSCISSKQMCTAGTYSLSGSATCTYCPEGTVGDANALTTPACNGSCGDNMTSPAGTSDWGDCYYTDCSDGYYLSEGVCYECGGNQYYCVGSVRHLVDTGFYSTGQTSLTRTGESECPLGSYCQSGVMNSCPCGTYGAAKRLTSSSCSGSCSANYFCPAGSTSSTQTPCAGGYFSLSGACYGPAIGSPSWNNCHTCSAGYFFDYNDVGNCNQCGDSNHFSAAGTYGSCTTVSTGYYSTGGTPYTRTGQTPCPSGHYCQDGDDKGLCPAGKYCQDGQIKGDCWAGYYCPAGSTSPTQNDCPQDNYCLGGSSAPSPCGAGTCTGGTTRQSQCLTPKYTCSSYNAHCGNPPDNCGGTLPSCGTCSSGYACDVNYQCVKNCTDGYLDSDGDGYGSTTWGCFANVSDNDTDCDDGSAAVWSWQDFYTDVDNDGYRPSGYRTKEFCWGIGHPSGYTDNTDGIDCLDSNADVHPNQSKWFSSPVSGAPLSGWDYNCSNSIEYQINNAPVVGQCYSVPGGSGFQSRAGDTVYSFYCSNSYCGYKYNGGSSWSCQFGPGCSGSGFASCTPGSSLAARH